MPNGIDILAITIGLALLLLIERTVAWHIRVERRRLERRVHTNLMRIPGGRR